MGFLERLLGKQPADTTEALRLPAAGIVRVVGERYRQPTLERLAIFGTSTPEPFTADLVGEAGSLARRDEKRWFEALLVPEPDNPHDPNAIAVHAGGYGLVGYLDRQTAVDYAPVFAELARRGIRAATCPAKLTGGDDISWGVILALSQPQAVLDDLRDDS